MEVAGVHRNPATDALLAWFKGEFTAANAIIDALCHHLRAISGPERRLEYDQVFAAVHRRRMNWIPILRTQRYFSIAEVVMALRDAARTVEQREEVLAENVAMSEEMADEGDGRIEQEIGDAVEKEEDRNELMTRESAEEVVEEEDEEGLVTREEQEGEKAVPEATLSALIIKEEDAVPAEVSSDLPAVGNLTSPGLSNNLNQQERIHDFPESDVVNERPARIKATKGFSAKEPIDGHMVNVVKGLKMYDQIFIDLELSNLASLANELRVSGQKGMLSGETYISFNKQLKGNKREMIQLGVPIFGKKNEKPGEVLSIVEVEPIPVDYKAAIDRLVQWRLIPESRRPNCCIINFFDEGECSQPYLRPPHIEQPVSTLSLTSDCKMVFGRILMSDRHGNYKGSLELDLDEGSLVVMRGNSASTTHAICPSAAKRATVTFVKVNTEYCSNQSRQMVVGSRKPLTARRMTLWQVSSGVRENNKKGGGLNCSKLGGSVGPRRFRAAAMAAAAANVPRWGASVFPLPLVSVAPGWPVLLQRKRVPPAGTGVFIPSNAKCSSLEDSRNVMGEDRAIDNREEDQGY